MNGRIEGGREGQVEGGEGEDLSGELCLCQVSSCCFSVLSEQRGITAFCFFWGLSVNVAAVHCMEDLVGDTRCCGRGVF